ncbi:DEAD/DEAH box helicase [Desulfohalobium retbaense]|uniref:DEAD/DEAH box helicase domain protein n=1 Tax=Desulfohalobium retbaense (strain ATCC 49708 / DSM 5692 / JCM 16813 / HR100) TaxID=485915 RepID=C8WZA3_DESRD|nr:DEAD/DEAH box helicase [Desulfohalobium retbaense]ACV67378.1 DEAD/DEAH box helicase domain protein [Desulfohalobium retbaense DSM 5692]
MSSSAQVDAYLRALKDSGPYGSLVRHHATLPARAPSYSTPREPWPAPVQELCRQAGIDRLFSHQAEAVDHIRAGRHTAIATPTASGKSLTFALPIAEALCQDPESRALLLYPLKALAQDQLRALQAFTQPWPLEQQPRAAIYDGDTPQAERGRIRANPPHLLCTNPDMLHLGLTPHHHSWGEFFSRLRFVIVDEVHTYRGVMGSHMAWVFRRLRRICRYWGSDPTFIFASATIGNPAQLAQNLAGVPVEAVTENGAAQGKRHMVFLDALEGAPQTALGLLQAALARGLRTIVYTQSRKYTELLAMWLSQRSPRFADRVSAYRSGFLPEERREIETALANGSLLGVISTSALELGIDIGNLDLCLLVGYPGSVMATWQRSGRVGRGRQDSATILLGGEDALDQYFMHHPQAFFALPPEAAVINPDNPVIRDRHLVCAAADLPLQHTEPLVTDPVHRRAVHRLEQRGELLQSGSGEEWLSHRKTPHRQVSLRGTGRTLPILDSDSREHIGSVDGYRALRETHPGAVYLHRGQTYVVDRLDLEEGMVLARKQTVQYFTRVRAHKETTILETTEWAHVWGSRIHRGRLRVTETVTGYEKRHVRGQRLLRMHELDLPPHVFETEGIWLEIPDTVRQELEKRYLHFMGGIHAVEHALIGIMPLLVLADRNDLGGISTVGHEQLTTAAVFVYDGTPGGAGLTRQAFQRAGELLEHTQRTIRDCPCETGCPGCVHSPKCGSGNRPIAKDAALAVLQTLHTSQTPRSEPVIVQPAEEPDMTVTTDIPDNAGLPPLHYTVFDLETQRSAQEVGGWNRAKDMGISCAVVYDSALDTYVEYEEKDIPQLVEHLHKCDLVIGFNILRFDYQVLSGYSRADFQALPSLDLLRVVHKQLGYRLSLDKLAQATLQAQKTANGLQALQWWKEGRIRDIIDYCRQDVAVTRDLYRFGRDNGYLLFHNKAKQLVRVPVQWE